MYPTIRNTSTHTGPLAYHGTSTPASVGLVGLLPLGIEAFGGVTPKRPIPVLVCGMPIMPLAYCVLTTTGNSRSRTVRM